MTVNGSANCTNDNTQLSAAGSPIQSMSPHTSVCDEAKKARKRATDRKSQQNHRRRKKAYVRELENSVRAFERQCAANPNEISAAVVESYNKLQQRFEKAASLLERVRGILNDNTTVYVRQGSSTTGVDENDAKQTCLSATAHHDGHDYGATPSKSQSEYTSTILHDSSKSLLTLPETQMNTEANSSTVLDRLSCGLIPLESSDQPRSKLAVNGMSVNGDNRNNMTHPSFLFEENAPSECYPELLSGSNQGSQLCSDIIGTFPTDAQLLLDNYTLTAALITRPATSLNLETWSNPKLYAISPRHSPPAGPGARILENMVLEAKTEHARGHFGLAKPSLRQLMTDDSGDVLAFRLFHWLSSYGEMPLHLFLGIFWVQYLVLRWHVLQTEEDYNRIPYFMRPDSIERQIPHSIMIDMFIWPDLRHALIKQRADLYVESVGMDLIPHLKASWSPLVTASGDVTPSNLVASIDIMQIIERQAVTWDFWKIGPGFLRQHGQFNHCQIG